MHLLLPPSESKCPGGRGRPLRSARPRAHVSPELTAARGRVEHALQTLLEGDPGGAARALDLPRGLAADAMRKNAAVLDSPTMPALRRYTGTVYEGLASDTLPSDELRFAGRHVLIFSGLFGVLRGDEPVPDYRVPAKATLPAIGVAGTWWRPVLDQVLPPVLRRGLVVDLRSSDYSAMWRSRSEACLSVRILSPVPRGGYGVVSFTSKLSKGRLARELIHRAASGSAADSAADVLDAWSACDGADPGRTTAPVGESSRLDLYTR